MKVYLATDHAGFAHKNAVADWLRGEGFVVVDYGADVYDVTDDYTDFIAKAAHSVSKNPGHKAVIFGGTGQGEAMLANKFPHVRATVLYSDTSDIVELGRTHNDSNILSIGARFLSVDDTKKHVWNWLQLAGPTDARHQRRIAKLDALSNNLHS